MAGKITSHDAGIARSVEKQMRNWELSRAQRHGRAAQPEVADFITLANVCGAGGGEVAKGLAEELGWQVFDRELLTNMAKDDQGRAGLYHSMDERDLGWLENTLRSLTDESLRRNDYFHRLIEAVLCLARKGPGVFVGRSADLILPRNKGLRVKLMAPPDYCARRFAEQNGVGLEEARTQIDRVEAERRDFVRHHFRIDPADPVRFDLLVNVERFSTPEVICMIKAAHEQRLASAQPA